MPFTSRSSKIRVCSAAVPSAGIRKSTVIFGTSFCACSQPARAIVQKSEALLVKKATLTALFSWALAANCPKDSPSTAKESNSLDDFMMGVLYGFLNFTLLSSRRIIEPAPLVAWVYRLRGLHSDFWRDHGWC